MTKLCSVCGTENRDEAQFCRSCGTAFPPPAAAHDEEAQLAAGITCDECNFQNKPGVRYCANCGVSLLGTVIVPRARSGAAAPDPFSGTSPPPINYPSFAPVAPYPPPPVTSSSYPPVAASGGYGSPPPGYPPAYDEPLNAPDIADPAAALAVMHRHEDDDVPTRPPAAVPAAATKAPNRAPLVLGLAVVVLVAAGAGGWWFMNRSSGPQAEPAPASAPMAAPAVVESAPVVAAPASMPASAPDVAVAPPEPAASPVAAVVPPPMVETTPPVAMPPTVPAVDPDAARIAAEKRREKAARDKADREAKAKVLAEQQQQQAAAAARAEQDAARRRAEEAQRARAVPSTPPPAPVVQARGVRELCAGRGSIAESICRSRECGSPEHANEAVCKQQKEIEDKHRN